MSNLYNLPTPTKSTKCRLNHLWHLCDINARVAVLEGSPGGSSRTNLQVLVLVLVLEPLIPYQHTTSLIVINIIHVDCGMESTNCL